MNVDLYFMMFETAMRLWLTGVGVLQSESRQVALDAVHSDGNQRDWVLAVVVWCGVVWCGVVWCGVVWCGVVWCSGVVV